MLIISVRDNENNIWKRNAAKKKKKKKKMQERKRKTKAIVKGRELNDFAAHLC